MAVTINDPRPVLRQELARVFKNQRVIRAFEKIFDLIPPEFIDQQIQIDTINLVAALAASQTSEALSAVERLTSAIDQLSMAPKSSPFPDSINLTSVPPLDTTIIVSWTGLHTFTAGINVTGTAAVTGNITATTTIAATGAISGSNLSATGGANPSVLSGLAAINGVATTYMRSDSSPALSQAILPVWTDMHTFNGVRIPGIATSGVLLGQQSVDTPYVVLVNAAAAADGRMWQQVVSGANTIFRVVNDAFSAAAAYLQATRVGTTISALAFGNATDNPTYTFLGTGVPKHGGNQLIQTSAALTNNAAAAAGTLLNAPVAGNPTKWIPINDNGTIRNIPAW